MDLRKLAEPFPAEDVKWRLARGGMKEDGKTPWAKILCYIDARHIMDRLDEVCGPENWRVRYTYEGGGVMCHLAIRIVDNGRNDFEWVEKSDGAEQTDIEKFKGGISDALKRAGNVWRIGRYLYTLDEGWADCSTDRWALTHKNATAKDKQKKDFSFSWNVSKEALNNLRAAGAGASKAKKAEGAPTATTMPQNADEEQREEAEEHDAEFPVTNAQKQRIGILRSKGKIPEDKYRDYLEENYGIRSAKDLTRLQAKHLIEKLERRNERRESESRNADATETFSAEPRIKKLREQVVGLCLKLKGWGERTANKEPIDYPSYGLNIESVDELVDALPHMEDEGELEGVIKKLDNLFAGEVF